MGAVTVSVATSLSTEPNDAVMSVFPSPTPVAKPAKSTVATPVSELAQVTLDVISAVLVSEYVPVAVYC